MVREVEAKILDINITTLEARLRKMGAKLLFDEDIVDEIFRSKEPKKRTYRFRERAGMRVVTYKEDLGESTNLVKVREERDRIVGLYEDKYAIFQHIQDAGFRHHATRAKRRKKFSLDGLAFAIDQYASIPPLLEIESINEQKTITKIEREILERARMLGFSERELRPWGFGRVSKYHARERKLLEHNIREVKLYGT